MPNYTFELRDGFDPIEDDVGVILTDRQRSAGPSPPKLANKIRYFQQSDLPAIAKWEAYGKIGDAFRVWGKCSYIVHMSKSAEDLAERLRSKLENKNLCRML